MKNDIPMAHGFRRFFNTALMNADVHPSFKKLLMGHSVELDEVYYDKGSEKSKAKLLEEYCKAIDYLTINEENRLRKKVEELTPKSDEIQAMKAELKKRKEESEELGLEQIHNYIKSNPRLDGSYIDVTRDSYTTSKDKDDVNDAS
jgi:hypothetical protein